MSGIAPFPHASPLPAARGPTRVLAELIAARTTEEGTTLAGYGGMCLYRVTRPTRYRKAQVVGPRVLVIAQGRKVAKFPDGNLTYDEDHLLVLTGETTFDGVVLDATPERPHLGMCVELPPDVVARTLLAIADVAPLSGATLDEGSPGLPAFVSPLTEPLTNAIARLLRSLDDPLERKVVAPLVIDELVFRLLRTSAAAVLRRAVRDSDASIQKAMRYIRDNAARPLTVESVARHVGMGASHFAHRFRAVARVSPMRFVKHVRLDAARELMVSEGLRAKDAATRVGYESASHFTRDFKLAYGAAPAEYVRRVHAQS